MLQFEEAYWPLQAPSQRLLAIQLELALTLRQITHVSIEVVVLMEFQANSNKQVIGKLVKPRARAGTHSKGLNKTMTLLKTDDA